MGFYSANTPEQKRVKQLTGDININDMFKNECNTRGIPIYNAYNIQKRLIHEVEQEQLVGVDQVDDRLMELLEERGKNKVTHRYVDFVSKEDSASRGVIPAMPKQESISNASVPNRARPAGAWTFFSSFSANLPVPVNSTETGAGMMQFKAQSFIRTAPSF